MKKVIAFLLAVGIVISAYGCKSQPAKPNDTTGNGATNEEIVHKSYTVSDEAAAAARETVVAHLGDTELTNGVLQMYYWMGVYTFMGSDYGAYPEFYGLDYAKPLDQQSPVESEKSWQEYFLEDAFSTWHVYRLLANTMAAEGIKLPEEQEQALENRLEELKKAAKEKGFQTLDELIQSDAGAGCTLDDYMDYTRTYYEYTYYVNYLLDQVTYTQEDLDAYFEKNRESLEKSKITKTSGDVYGVRHILIVPEGGSTKDNVTTYTDAEWEACRVKAQALLDQWLAGEATEDSFSALAKEHSEDPGSKATGGLYEGLDKETSFVKPFKDWYLEEGRQIGDYGLVKTDYGYHLMYLSDIEAQWLYYSRHGYINDVVTEKIENLKTANPYTVDWDKIVLAEVELLATS